MTINELAAMSASDLSANDALQVWDSEAGSGIEPTKKITAGNMANRLTSIANNGYADITINPTYATGGGRCFKLGKIVFAELRVKCVTTVTMSDVFAVVPAGFRPKVRTADMTCGLYSSGSLNYYTQYCFVDTNGNINHALSSAGIPANTWIMMDFIYETD